MIQKFKSFSSCLFPTPVTIMGTQTFKFKENHTGLHMHNTLARHCKVFLTVANNKLRLVRRNDGNLSWRESGDSSYHPQFIGGIEFGDLFIYYPMYIIHSDILL